MDIAQLARLPSKILFWRLKWGSRSRSMRSMRSIEKLRTEHSIGDGGLTVKVFVESLKCTAAISRNAVCHLSGKRARPLPDGNLHAASVTAAHTCQIHFSTHIIRIYFSSFWKNRHIEPVRTEILFCRDFYEPGRKCSQQTSSAGARSSDFQLPLMWHYMTPKKIQDLILISIILKSINYYDNKMQ